jgi:hypothetical protein
MTALERARNDIYMLGIFWILRERAGAGGWPPTELEKVCGWTVVRMLAALSHRTPRSVAADLIDHYRTMEAPDVVAS